MAALQQASNHRDSEGKPSSRPLSASSSFSSVGSESPSGSRPTTPTSRPVSRPPRPARSSSRNKSLQLDLSGTSDVRPSMKAGRTESQVNTAPIAGDEEEGDLHEDTHCSTSRRSSNLDDLNADSSKERIRSTLTSGIPVAEKKNGNRKRFGVVNMSAPVSALPKGQAIPTAESLGVMMEKARIGETTFSEGYPSAPGGRRISDDGNIIVKPLSIKRKAPPALKLQAVSTSPLQQPDRRLPIDDTPPHTPPPLTHSVYSDSNTDEDSLRSSFNSPAQAAHIARLLNLDNNAVPMIPLPPINMYLKHRIPSDEAMQQDLPDTKAETGMNGQVDPDSIVPAIACPLVAEPDIPGKMPSTLDRRPSAWSTASSDIIDDGDDEDMQNFSLEDFPVPSVVLASPTSRRFSASSDGTVPNSPATPRVSALRPGLTAPVIGASPRSVQSIPTPRPDLFRINSSRTTTAQWDLAEELEIRDRVFRAEMARPSKADKAHRKALKAHFSATLPPNAKQLYEASLLSVRDEYGNRIRFGSLFEKQRTIVCFIRHFWCSQCQDYMDSISKVRPAILEKYGLRLIVISNGSWKMIKPYKKLLGDKCPYPIYTDRPKNVYNALGMTLRTFNAGKEKDGTVGKYIKHSLGGSIIAGVQGGLQLPMKPPGDQQQLGGEFILGPGLQVKFTHRMKSTRNHAEIEMVLASVDVDLEKELEILAPTPMVATPVIVPPSPAMTNRSKRVSMNGTGSNKLRKEPGSPSSTPKLGTWLHKRNLSSKQVNQDKRPLVKDLGISSATVFAAQNGNPPDSSADPSPEARSHPTFQTDTEPPTPQMVNGEYNSDSTGQEDESRRFSIPHKIPTPTPHSPLSTHFLQVDDGTNGSSRNSRRRPSSMGALMVPSVQLTSADLEASSSRFSSSSEESQNTSSRVRGLFGHLQLRNSRSNNNESTASLQSRTSSLRSQNSKRRSA